MATSPFSAALVTALKGDAHAGNFAAVQGPAKTPAFFCCISGNTVGVAKDPVPVGDIDADYVCVDEDVTLDYSLSWSPTDTIASWDVDWGDGQVSNGAWPGAGSVSHPLGGYAAAGKYDIVLTMTDTLGAEGTIQLQVIVVDCSDTEAMDESSGIDFVDERWANFDDAKSIISGRNYVWRNTLLEGGGSWLKVETNQISTSQIEDIQITREPGGTEYFYVARWDGIFGYPIPPYNGVWRQYVSTSDMITAAGLNPATYGTFSAVRDLAMIRDKPGWGYAWWEGYFASGVSQEAVWGVAFTRNGWRSIAWSTPIDTISLNVPETQNLGDGQVACVQDSDGQIVFACGGKFDTGTGDDQNYIWVSTNYGLSWTKIGQDNGFIHDSYCIVPNNWNGIAYWSTGNRTLRGNAIGFSNFANVNGRLSADPEDPRYVVVGDTGNIWEITPSNIKKFGANWPAGTAKHFVVIRRNEDKTLEDILWIGDNGAVAKAYLMNRDGTLTDVTGLWLPSFYDYLAVARPETEEYLVYP